MRILTLLFALLTIKSYAATNRHVNVLSISTSTRLTFEFDRQQAKNLNKNVWKVIAHNNLSDIIDWLNTNLSDCILDTLEISSHGSTTTFGNLSIRDIEPWSKNLIETAKQRRIDISKMIIYLSGCNSAIPYTNGAKVSIGQLFSNYTEKVVKGTKGYFCGLNSTKTAICTECIYNTDNGCRDNGGLINRCRCGNKPEVCYELNGSCDAEGNNAWYQFEPQRPIRRINKFLKLVLQKEKLSFYNSSENVFSFSKEKIKIDKNIYAAIDSVMTGKSFDLPDMKWAPDYQISLDKEGRDKLYEIYGNVSILYDKDSSKAYYINQNQYKILNFFKPNLK